MGSIGGSAGGMFGDTGLFGTKETGEGKKQSIAQYQQQLSWIQNDPYLNQALGGLGKLAGKNWLGYGKQMGLSAADLQANQLQNALAARGGGDLSSALGMGAKARAGTELTGLQAGFGMKQGALSALSGAASTKLGLMGNLYAALSGVMGADIKANAAIAAAQISGQAQMIGALLGKNWGGQGTPAASVTG